MIGYRGCYRYVHDPSFFRLELAALARVREESPGVAIMIPFVRTRWELEACLALVDDSPLGRQRGLRRWVMAEVPSVAYWLPEYIGLGVDGVSIGSNDLTQLVLGVDRDSADLAELFDEADPAVLAVIDRSSAPRGGWGSRRPCAARRPPGGRSSSSTWCAPASRRCRWSRPPCRRPAGPSPPPSGVCSSRQPAVRRPDDATDVGRPDAHAADGRAGAGLGPVVAGRDRVGRPGDAAGRQVNGSKARWAWVIGINFFGPLAYFRWGRRPSG